MNYQETHAHRQGKLWRYKEKNIELHTRNFEPRKNCEQKNANN